MIANQHPQWIMYLIYKCRLATLSRQVTKTNWRKDLLVSRLARSFDSGTGRLVGFVVSVFAAATALWAKIAGNLSYLYLLLFIVLWLLAEVVALTCNSFRLANIRTVMFRASKTLAGAGKLGETWELGQRNLGFLDELFAQYEPHRALLLGVNGPVVRVLDDHKRQGKGKAAGVWIMPLPSRLTDVVSNAPNPAVKTQLDISGPEQRLLGYAASSRADARTRFLRQWRQNRLREAEAKKQFPTSVDALNENDLHGACKNGEEGLNYVLHSVVGDAQGIQLNVDRAGYGQIMRSCDYLIEEAFIAAGVCAGTRKRRELDLRGKWLLRALPARQAVMEQGTAELLLKPERRAVGIGLAAVIVVQESNENSRLYFKERSTVVGTYPEMYHGVPTGMFNAKTRDTDTEHDQRLHPGRVLMTEFFEEIKDARDLGGFDADPHWVELLSAHLDWLFRSPKSYHERKVPSGPHVQGADSLAYIRSTAPGVELPNEFNPTDMRVWVTGLAFDLLSLRPEICCVIELPDGPVKKIYLNEEGAKWFEFPSSNTKKFAHLPPSGHWVRSGYAAMTLAHELVQGGLDPATACTPLDFGIDVA